MPTSDESPKILILAGSNWQGLGRLPRILAKAGCRVTTIATPVAPVARSRFVDRVIRVASLPDLLQTIPSHLAEQDQPYDLIIPGDDPTLVALAGLPRAPWLQAVLPVLPASEALATVRSKVAFTLACQRAAIPLPPSRVCANHAELNAAAADIGYPLILKSDFGFAGSGVRRVNAPADLPDAVAALSGWPLIVQQFVDGRVGAVELLYDRGRLACWHGSYKARCAWTFGPSTAREMLADPRLEAIAEQLGRLTGFHGFCGYDFMQAADGTIYVLELNGRPTSAYHIGPHVGVDFGRALLDMLQGRPNIQRPTIAQRPNPMLIRLYPQDIIRCIASRDWTDLLRWLPFASIHDTPWDDPAVLFRGILQIANRCRNELFGGHHGKPTATNPPPKTPATGAPGQGVDKLICC